MISEQIKKHFEPTTQADYLQTTSSWSEENTSPVEMDGRSTRNIQMKDVFYKSKIVYSFTSNEIKLSVSHNQQLWVGMILMIYYLRISIFCAYIVDAVT